MQVTLTTKLDFEMREEFVALAHAQELSPSALLRMIVTRYIEGDGNIHTMINALGEDLTRILVLSRFLAEKVDHEATDQLLQDTDTYLADTHPKGAHVSAEVGHG